MKKFFLPFYVFIVILNIIPSIPLSIKGIMGLVLIVVSSVMISFRDGIIVTSILVILEFTEFFLGINVDYKNGIVSMLLGTAVYFITVFTVGSYVETIKKKTKELEVEIERRKAVEKELKKKITLLQSLMDTIPSPIFFKDLDLKYAGGNHAFQSLTGFSTNEFMGKSVYDVSNPELADIYNEMDRVLLISGGSQMYEGIVKFADGSLRNIIFNKAVYSDESGNPSGIVGVMTDITDKKEALELKQNIIEKKQIIDEIMENERVKTEFFSNISHELRTPVNVILGSVQLMELYIRNNQFSSNIEKVIKNVGAMKQNCLRLIRLVNNLIDITKIDASAFELHLRKCNIVNVIEEITLSVSDYIENKGIDLIFDTDIEEKIMACDDEKIERIMLNLLSNAVKFTPDGGEIFVSIYDRDDGICITVEDNGVGIPEDKQDQIFQRFCQIDKMFTRQHEGSGIGLSLVKSLVEMHKGTITFESKVGKGTCFTIYLPCTEIEENGIQYNALSKQTNVEKINIEFSDIYSIGA